MNGALDRFRDREYLNLETYRRNGEGVRTPLWFVEEGGLLYAETLSETGKVKRLRKDARVRVVPSDRRGKPEGEWVEGEAYLVGGDEAQRVRELLCKKYGLQKKLVGVMYRFMKGEPVVISIHLGPNPGGRGSSYTKRDTQRGYS